MSPTAYAPECGETASLEAEEFPFRADFGLSRSGGLPGLGRPVSADAERLNALAEELSLDPHAIEDASSAHERPKATRYATHLFLSAYAVRYNPDTGELDLSNISAFGLERGMVTVRLDDQFRAHSCKSMRGESSWAHSSGLVLALPFAAANK